MTTPNSAEGKPAVNSASNPQVPAQGTPNPAAAGTTAPAPTGDGKTVPLSALHESREQTRAVKEEMENLKQTLAKMTFGQNSPYGSPAPATGYQPYNAAPANPTVQANAQELDRMWDENPRQAMQTEMGMMLNWYDGVNAQIDAQEEEASKKFPDYEQYRTKIRGYLRMVQPEMRNRPGTVETAYFLAKGQDTDAIKASAIDEVIKKIQAGETIQGITGTTATTQAPVTTARPTNEEIKVAEAMNMSVEDYLKFKKGGTR